MAQDTQLPRVQRRVTAAPVGGGGRRIASQPVQMSDAQQLVAGLDKLVPRIAQLGRELDDRELQRETERAESTLAGLTPEEANDLVQTGKIYEEENPYYRAAFFKLHGARVANQQALSLSDDYLNNFNPDADDLEELINRHFDEGNTLGQNSDHFRAGYGKAFQAAASQLRVKHRQDMAIRQKQATTDLLTTTLLDQLGAVSPSKDNSVEGRADFVRDVKRLVEVNKERARDTFRFSNSEFDSIVLNVAEALSQDTEADHRELAEALLNTPRGDGVASIRSKNNEQGLRADKLWNTIQANGVAYFDQQNIQYLLTVSQQAENGQIQDLNHTFQTWEAHRGEPLSPEYKANLIESAKASASADLLRAHLKGSSKVRAELGLFSNTPYRNANGELDVDAGVAELRRRYDAVITNFGQEVFPDDGLENLMSNLYAADAVQRAKDEAAQQDVFDKEAQLAFRVSLQNRALNGEELSFEDFRQGLSIGVEVGALASIAEDWQRAILRRRNDEIREIEQEEIRDAAWDEAKVEQLMRQWAGDLSISDEELQARMDARQEVNSRYWGRETFQDILRVRKVARELEESLQSAPVRMREAAALEEMAANPSGSLDGYISRLQRIRRAAPDQFSEERAQRLLNTFVKSAREANVSAYRMELTTDKANLWMVAGMGYGIGGQSMTIEEFDEQLDTWAGSHNELFPGFSIVTEAEISQLKRRFREGLEKRTSLSAAGKSLQVKDQHAWNRAWESLATPNRLYYRDYRYGDTSISSTESQRLVQRVLFDGQNIDGVAVPGLLDLTPEYRATLKGLSFEQAAARIQQAIQEGRGDEIMNPNALAEKVSWLAKSGMTNPEFQRQINASFSALDGSIKLNPEQPFDPNGEQTAGFNIALALMENAPDVFERHVPNGQHRAAIDLYQQLRNSGQDEATAIQQTFDGYRAFKDAPVDKKAIDAAVAELDDLPGWWTGDSPFPGVVRDEVSRRAEFWVQRGRSVEDAVEKATTEFQANYSYVKGVPVRNVHLQGMSVEELEQLSDFVVSRWAQAERLPVEDAIKQYALIPLSNGSYAIHGTDDGLFSADMVFTPEMVSAFENVRVEVDRQIRAEQEAFLAPHAQASTLSLNPSGLASVGLSPDSETLEAVASRAVQFQEDLVSVGGYVGHKVRRGVDFLNSFGETNPLAAENIHLLIGE